MPVGDKIRVVIVDDVSETRENVRKLLQFESDVEVVGLARTGKDAIQISQELNPDVVLMDIHLPNMSGMACSRRLKDLCPLVQILILTVYEDNERVFGALKAGASGYLLKRADPADILRAIQEVKQGGAPMSSQIARKVVAAFQRGPGNELDELSNREKEILELLSKGLMYKEIAAFLGENPTNGQSPCCELRSDL